MANLAGFLTIVLLLGCAQQGLSFDCHTCDSGTTDACLDPYKPQQGGSWPTPCGPNESAATRNTMMQLLHRHFPGIASEVELFTPVCVKIKYSTNEATSNKDREIFRSCSPFGESTCKMITASLEQDGGQVHSCDVCQGHLCNGALPTRALAAPLALLLCALLKALW